MQPSRIDENVSLCDWRNLTTDQHADLAKLRLLDRQAAYAGTIAKALAECRSSNPSHLRGFAVLVASEIVGFFILKRPPASPDWARGDAVTLHGLMIDTRHQGRGVGQSAFAAAIKEARRIWPEAEQLALSVDADNDIGRSLYLKFGMSDSSPIFHGRIGLLGTPLCEGRARTRHNLTLQIPTALERFSYE